MRYFFPILISFIGLLSGAGVGMFLRPAPPFELVGNELENNLSSAKEMNNEPNHSSEFIKMSNQFVVPVLEGGRVISMVILNLSLEVKSGASEEIYNVEPKLRDAFLQVLFDHANSGGFNGAFTDGQNLTFLRNALKEVAQSTVGEYVTDVLVTDLARQDS